MEQVFCLNGRFLSLPDSGFSPLNRAYRFGDGVFETIRILGGKPLYWEDHYHRFLEGLRVLGIESAVLPEQENLAGMMGELVHQYPGRADGRLRLTGFRSGEGLDLPETNQLEWMMVFSPFATVTTSEAQTACLSLDYRIFPSPFSRIKSLNRLPYVLAAREAAAKGTDMAVLLNPEGAVADAVSSNLFFVVNPRQVITPPVSDGALPGVMRKRLLALLPEWGVNVEEARVLPGQFPSFQEVWSTNVIRGIVPIHTIFADSRVDYSVILGAQFQDKLNQYLLTTKG